MHFDIRLINGLMFGIAHASELYIEYDDEPDSVSTASGIIIMLGFFQLAFIWED
jgi:hypothetical protein